MERASAAAGPARAWLLEHARISGQQLEPLARAVRAPQGFEALVEHLLSGDAEALMIPSIQAAAGLASDVLESGRDGQVSLLPAGGMRPGVPARQAAQACGGKALVDMLEYPEQARFYGRGAARRRGGLRSRSRRRVRLKLRACRMPRQRPFDSLRPDGCIAWPSGKLTVGTVDAGAEGRARHVRASSHEAARIA